MKALVKDKPSKGLSLVEVSEPDYGINDVLIRVDRTGICGTDLHIYQWDKWAQQTIPIPLVVGHEFVGEIIAIGDNVSDFKVGDLVSGEGHVVCGRCRNCMAGKRHYCADTKSVGVTRPGAFAEFISLPMTNIWHHKPDIDMDIASIFDPFGNAVHTALTFPVLGEDVLITGAGPIGIMATAIAKHAGARHVVVTDINPYRLDLARTMGASLALNARETDIRSAFERLNMTEGFDVGLEMSGNAKALNDMIDNMCHGGKIAMLGIPAQSIAIDWGHLVLNMLTIKGVYGRRMYETWYQMTVLLESGLNIKPAITHHFHFTDYQKAFEIMESGQSGKIILDWNS